MPGSRLSPRPRRDPRPSPREIRHHDLGCIAAVVNGDREGSIVEEALSARDAVLVADRRAIERRREGGIGGQTLTSGISKDGEGDVVSGWPDGGQIAAPH